MQCCRSRFTSLNGILKMAATHEKRSWAIFEATGARQGICKSNGTKIRFFAALFNSDFHPAVVIRRGASRIWMLKARTKNVRQLRGSIEKHPISFATRQLRFVPLMNYLMPSVMTRTPATEEPQNKGANGISHELGVTGDWSAIS